MTRKYIWLNRETDESYAEFQNVFSWSDGPVRLEITADYQFAAFVNGELAANSQYADLPDYKVVSTYDVTALCRKGENTLTVLAQHPGQDHFQSRKMTACVSYALLCAQEVLAASTENTLCRESALHIAGDQITAQLGMGCNYDFTAQSRPWQKATVVEPGFQEVKKPIANTYLSELKAKPLLFGAWHSAGGETAAECMQRAWQRPENSMLDCFPVTVKTGDGDGVYLLWDLGCETTGYPYFDITCEEEATAWLGWGEHLTDGRIRTYIDGRNFALTLRFREGKNHFAQYLRRIGGRYLCLYVQTHKAVTVHQAGIWEERYPFRRPGKDFGDRLLNAMYEAGRRTLELCAHQHYEDCPWREQALYGMDSRNQMLFGYGAFEEYAFPRANLLLMAKSLAPDGLLHLCPPSRSEITIPSFSAYWVLACYENACADFREDFVRAVLPAAERVMAVFRANTQGGTVCTLSDIRYWNFHEWSPGLDGGKIFRTQTVPAIPDASLSAICCRAAMSLAGLEAMVGQSEKSQFWQEYADSLIQGFTKFFVAQKGMFASYLPGGMPQGFHEFTQCLLLSTQQLRGEMKDAVVRALKSGKDMVPVTLSGLCYKYEGLLACGEEEFVLEDMLRNITPMLAHGGTYWETGLGQRDFDNAGSLCHGWSAVPCYVLDHIFSTAKQISF